MKHANRHQMGVKYANDHQENPNSNNLVGQPTNLLLLGPVHTQEFLVSDIFPQNASDTKHAVGAGGGNRLDLLLHPGGWRQALHPLKDVPQGVNQIFVFKT